MPLRIVDIMKTITVEHLKNCIGIGIDVSKESLSCAGITQNSTYKSEIKNTLSSIDNFARKLVKADYKGKIICESTGHYHLKLALIFTKYNLNLYVINPLLSSKYSKANIRKVKSDPADAESLGNMCITERNLPKPALLTEDKVLKRLKMGQIRSTEKIIQRMQSSLNLYEETYRELNLKGSSIQDELKATLKNLKTLKERMDNELEKLIIESSSNDEVIRNIDAIPGITSSTAALISEFDTDVKSANSWVAYIGYDVSVRQSGKWKGQGKLTKRGNKYLRKKLFCAAWGATMHDKHFKAYYEKLRADGRSYFEAICIIAKKLLKIAYQIAVNGKKYDAKLAFPEQNI